MLPLNEKWSPRNLKLGNGEWGGTALDSLKTELIIKHKPAFIMVENLLAEELVALNKCINSWVVKKDAKAQVVTVFKNTYEK